MPMPPPTLTPVEKTVQESTVKFDKLVFHLFNYCYTGSFCAFVRSFHQKND